MITWSVLDSVSISVVFSTPDAIKKRKKRLIAGIQTYTFEQFILPGTARICWSFWRSWRRIKSWIFLWHVLGVLWTSSTFLFESNLLRKSNSIKVAILNQMFWNYSSVVIRNTISFHNGEFDINFVELNVLAVYKAYYKNRLYYYSLLLL